MPEPSEGGWFLRRMKQAEGQDAMITRGTRITQQDEEHGTPANTLTERQVGCLLAERGFHLVERMQHIHASHHGQEWHICQQAELAWLTAEQFLQRLQEALSFRLVSLEPSADRVRPAPERI